MNGSINVFLYQISIWAIPAIHVLQTTFATVCASHFPPRAVAMPREDSAMNPVYFR
jgi:hypothetical protein